MTKKSKTARVAALVRKRALAGEDPIPTREDLEKILLGDLSKWL